MRYVTVFVTLTFLLLGAAGCGDDDGSGSDATTGPDSATVDDGGVGPDSSNPPDASAQTITDKARALSTHLRGQPDFMIGLGNDNSGPYDHNIPIDLHYAYLVGYGDDGGGWPNWNTDGAYVTNFADNADAHGVTPMFTYYQFAFELEVDNYGVFTSDRMHQYLLDYVTLYERLAAYGGPAVVTIEPDFFGYLENQVRQSGVGVNDMPATLHYGDFTYCDHLPETVAGMTQCLVSLARQLAPQVRVGFHASQWGAWYDSTDPTADAAGAGTEVGEFLITVGAAQTDFVTVETLDRDAGFWEAQAGGGCSITDGPRGAVYWDPTNATLPNFVHHLDWVHALTAATQLPAVWWQTPLGEPSDQCGGTSGQYRDSRVFYFFSHIDELISAGGAAATFGTGAGEQTTVSSDNDQFKNAATSYSANPHSL